MAAAVEGEAVTIEIAVAVIAAVPPTLAAVLAFFQSRSVRRQVATKGEAPIGAVVERLERRVERLGEEVSGLVDRLAHLEGREVLPVRLDRRVERLDEELCRLSERLARIEAKGAAP
jgi:predicted nuclease with TOPRIM domain